MDRKSKDYYRSQFNKYLDRVDRAEILRRANVDKGNFSSFLSGRTTLSNKKLQMVLDEMIMYTKPTNKNRLTAMSVHELVDEANKIYFDNPLKEYFDLEKWLLSKNPKPAYKGEEAKYIIGDKSQDCIVVSNDKKRKNNVLIIVEDENTKNDKILSINKNKVELKD